MELSPMAGWLLALTAGLTSGYLLSLVLEGWPRFTQLAGYRKRLYIMLATILGLPLLGILLYRWLAPGWPGPEAITACLNSGFMAFAASQYGHAPWLKVSGLRKRIGSQVLDAYQNNMGLAGALTSDGGTRFHYACERIVKEALKMD